MHVPYPPTVPHLLLHSPPPVPMHGQHDVHIDELTDREMAVFQMLGEGYSMRDIAKELDLSRKTIETYRRRAKEKLRFDTVSELLQYAVQWSYGRGTLNEADEPA